VSRDEQHPLKPASTAITAGRAASGSSLAPALWGSSVWQSTCMDDANQRATSLRPGQFYGRYANPTVRSFEEAIAELEGAEEAMAFASGMGAIATTVLTLCSAGDHIVAPRQIYAGTLAFLQAHCSRFGIETTIIDGTRPGAFAEAVQPGRTTLVLAETPSNPRLELCDLDEIGSISGPFTLVDSTFATPLGQQPLAHGVDLVLHSATKGIAGHNDATLGVLAGERELLEAIWSYGVLHGATASPFDALNALRGVRTLAVRTAHQSATALRLAEWLEQHPAVSAVHYPGLASHPQHDLAKRQMRQFGTVLAFDLAGGQDAVRRLFDTMRLARCATSLGGPETLVCHPVTTTHVSLTPEEQQAAGVTPGLVRVSVGLEDPDDLVADLQHALA
jgi:cystathionine beta-lyase/cystathionine gamma-synthase